jgi:dTDP-glucose pyrophosphorylase
MNTGMQDIEGFFVDPAQSLTDCMRCIDRNRAGLALVVDGQRRLMATITDGDIRRAILQRTPLETAVGAYLDAQGKRPAPIVASADMDRAQVLRIMTERKVRHIPVVDGDGQVTGIFLQDQIARELGDRPPIEAVVMAGGLGTRMRPLTETVPKPMLPVAGKPLLERMISRLKLSGFDQVNITTNYLKDKIVDHFGDGSGHGIALGYLDEDEPMGTAGSLRLMARPKGPILVINGDVLTDLDFKVMYDFHLDHDSLVTVGVHEYRMVVPYGVMEVEDGHVTAIREKPELTYFINAGIYILDPAAIDMIPESGRYDMTDLLRDLLASGRNVASFPIREYWLDIGQHEDYKRAEDDMKNGKLRL